MAIDQDVVAPTADQARQIVTVKDFERSDLYLKIFNYVEEYMSRYDPSHDFDHIQRVLALAKHIMAEETINGPGRKLNDQAMILAALLHDVGDRKYIQGGENTERMLSDLLTNNGCPGELVSKVVLIVENVSYSNEVKNPQVVHAVVRSHPELAIVQDADRLDAIGAIGIGRVFAYGAAKAPERGLQGSVDHFSTKLFKLEHMMKTETGKKLARERTQKLVQFKQWWEEENSPNSARVN